MSLLITVKEVTGNCPVYIVGDQFVIEQGHKLKPGRLSHICMHSLASIMPYYVALSKGISPQELGLAQQGNSAFVQCLDPCKYTGGGTVVFEITSLIR